MLTNLATVQQIPGLANQTPAFLEIMIGAADRAIKNYCKRDLEQTTYTEYFSGDNQPHLILRQRPVIGTASLAVYFDPTGYYGRRAGGFGTGTLLTEGTNYVLEVDSGGVNSNRGLLVAISGAGLGAAGGGWWNWSGMPAGAIPNKLAASRRPFWPWGLGNIKVVYSAGYNPIPADLSTACTELVAFMVRNLPAGTALNNESLGNYSYSVAQRSLQNAPPELGTVAQTLGRYREYSMGI